MTNETPVSMPRTQTILRPFSPEARSLVRHQPHPQPGTLTHLETRW